MNKHHEDALNYQQASLLGPGQRLREARETADLKPEQIAERLRLPVRVIAAIEEDDYSQTPAQTFVRGYLRAYAKLVDVDADLVVDAFNVLNIPEQLELDRSILKSASYQKSSLTKSLRMRLSTFGISLLLLFLVTMWWRGLHTPPVTTEDILSLTSADNGIANLTQQAEHTSLLAEPIQPPQSAKSVSTAKHANRVQLSELKQTHYHQQLQMDFATRKH